MNATKRSTKGGKRGGYRKTVPLSPEMALAMLESAVSYCQQAGLCIQAANSKEGMLGLFVLNAHYILTDNGTRAAFRLGKLPDDLDYNGEPIMAQALPAAGISAHSTLERTNDNAATI